jgi:hypothetical protein
MPGRTDYKPDIISELAGMDSRYRISAKFAAREVVRQGQELFDLLLDRAMAGAGLLAERCAEACSRAARENPGLAEARQEDIVKSLLSVPEPRMRLFYCDMLLRLKVKKAQAKKIAALCTGWLSDEEEKGLKVIYLEAIASLARHETSLRPLAEALLEKALKSPVPSYSARARQIIMRAKKNTARA